MQFVVRFDKRMDSECHPGWLCARALSSLLLYTWLLCAQAGGCPLPCDCGQGNSSVSCARRGLANIPDSLPAQTASLDLSGNAIAGIRQGDFSQLHQLVELNLQDNLLPGVEPGTFGELPRLRELRLGGNRLTVLWPGTLPLPTLSILDLSRNPLAVLLDQTFSGLPRLQSLELGQELAFVSSQAFSGLGLLQRLSLEMRNSSQVPTVALSALGRLRSLTIKRLAAQTLGDDAFRGLWALRELALRAWPSLRALSPDSLQGLNLSSLSITGCNLTSVPYLALGHLVYLQRLDLSFNPIRVLVAGLFRPLPRLRELLLVGGQLLVVEPSAFGGLAQLRLLNLSNNGLVTLPQTAFHSLGSLESLGLAGNPLACDCRLLWLVRGRRSLAFKGQEPACASPAAAHGMHLADFNLGLLGQHFSCQQPSIKELVPTLASVSQGQTVGLQCKAEGVPKPTHTWVTPHNNSLTTQTTGRLRVLGDGTLEIRYAQLRDSGAYRCVATNAAGTDSAVAVVSVRDLLMETARVLVTAKPFVLDGQTLGIVTVMGFACFLGAVSLCFLLLFCWSRAMGPIDHTTDMDFVPRGTGTGDAESEGIKYTVKLL